MIKRFWSSTPHLPSPSIVASNSNTQLDHMSATCASAKHVASPALEPAAPTVNPVSADQQPENLSSSNGKANSAQRRSIVSRSWNYLYNKNKPATTSQSQTPAQSTIHEDEKGEKTTHVPAVRLARKTTALSHSDKRARESALIVRSLIVGPSADTASHKDKAPSAKHQLNKVKSDLLEPKTANKVIEQLRTLPASDNNALGTESRKQGQGRVVMGSGPIHAVCLEHPDAEVYERNFKRLDEEGARSDSVNNFLGVSGVAGASIEAVAEMIKNMHVVSLLEQPDLGLGQPGDGEGILSGAVPTAETVMSGIMQITPSLMALGYATGKACIPDHTGVYPPTDRISVLTYWWGLEVVLPISTLVYLSRAQSISTAVINFLTAMSMINEGVREILPFVRCIGQYIEFEFDTIKKQDKGKGVVCAATWIMPAAMVPRPWDFPDPPPKPAAQEAPQGSEAENAADASKPETPAAAPVTVAPIPQADQNPSAENKTPAVDPVTLLVPEA